MNCITRYSKSAFQTSQSQFFFFFLLLITILSFSVQDMGTVVLGKLESGTISKAQQLIMMPNRVRLYETLKFCLKSGMCG